LDTASVPQKKSVEQRRAERLARIQAFELFRINGLVLGFQRINSVSKSGKFRTKPDQYQLVPGGSILPNV
jgi:hypothetical protein